MSSWPTSNDYTAAIQSPQICFRDLDLKSASVEKHKLTRMPKVTTGNFAQVYELRSSSKRWAVKCFTRSAADLTARYADLAKAIASARLPYFVDFRFLADEMLVNGKRHPVVKMQWVDGQSLDKFIEANLHHSRVLLDIAAGLLKLVRDLEERNLAHGDLQHGNVVITTSGLKLVDYDGMFVPAFSGRAAPETGLPSYQHPRRRPSDYGVGLDRFALLVMCTGLCALAIEPGLWYEYNTGDNLLFTIHDFKDPNSSILFRRLSALGDSQLLSFVNALRTACDHPPLTVEVPSGAITLQASRRHVAWWVTSPADTSRKTAPATGDPYSASRTAHEFRHGGSIVLASIGVCALALGGFVGIEVGIITALLSGLAFLLERVVRYNAIPAMVRRRECESRLRQLRTELRKHTSKKTGFEQQVNAFQQQENQEKGQELRCLQDAHTSAYLSSIHISRLMDISGIGRYIVGNFLNAGIDSALQLKQRGTYVQGVGTKRRSQILGMLSQWERDASRGAPRQLPPDAEMRIATKYQQLRQPLVNQIGAISRRIVAIGSEVSNVEWQSKQIHVPTFAHFLKHTL